MMMQPRDFQVTYKMNKAGVAGQGTEMRKKMEMQKEVQVRN